MEFRRKKKSIIICSTEFITSKNFGGLAVFLEKFIKKLKKKYEINLILSSSKNKLEKHNGILIHNIDIDNFFFKILRRYQRWLFCIFQSFLINKKINHIIEDQNICFVHFSNYQYIGLFYNNLVPSITRLSSLENLWEKNSFFNINLFLEKISISKSKYILSPSHYLIKELKKIYKLDSVYLPPIIDKQKKISNRKNLKKIIVTFGSISPGKGSNTIVKIINDLLKIDKNIYYYWIGDIDRKYYKSNKEFEKILKNNTVFPNRVKVLKKKKRKDLFKFLNRSQIIILPSLRDNSPNACLESLSLRKPVIARNNSGYNDIIKNNFNGFLFNKNQPSEIIKLSSKILSLNKKQIQKLNKNIASYNQNFHPNRVIKIYENYLNKII